MLKTLTCLFSALIILSVPTIARACRSDVTPEDRIAESYDAVVVATITGVEPRTQSISGGLLLPTWMAKAKLVGTIDSSPTATSYVIDKPENLCEPSKAIAVIGESWVLYLRNSANGLIVAASYPLSLARKIDKRFTGQP